MVLADPNLITVADSDGLGLWQWGWLGELVVGGIALAALAERIRVDRQAVVVGRGRRRRVSVRRSLCGLW